MSPLSADEIDRYGRQINVPGVGPVGQERLQAGSVLAIGAGGLGSPALLYLAAAGVGRIGVVDDDAVDVTNLHRQIAHATADIGRSKALSATEAMRAINPHVEVVPFTQRLTAANAEALMADWDVVLDGSDNFPTRFLVNDACFALKKPLVTAAILRYSGQIAVLRPGKTACYRCVFSDVPPSGSVLTCASAGILGPVAGATGSIQALEAIKLLLGSADSISGHLVNIDFHTLETHVIPLQRDPGCALCGERPTIVGLHDAEDACALA